jgi:hypothetical protein
MTAIALPRPRKRASKPARVAKTTAKAWTAMKVGPKAAKTAKKGAKAWASFKVVKFIGRRGAKLLLIPLAAGGGLAAWKKVRSGSSESAPATPYGSPVGPAATPSTVTPPKTPPGSAGVNGEGALGDPAAGSANPPGAAS